MGERLTIEEAARLPAPPLHPFGGCDLGVFGEHFRRNQPVSGRAAKMKTLSLLGILARSPFTLYEKLRWEKGILARELESDPVFILGHWRSGTTHLHNLLSRDPRFGFLSFYQTSMPLNMLGKKVAIGRNIMERSLPKTRGFDNVKLTLDTPQEEDMALANLNPLSEYNTYYFPREAKRHFEEAVLFEGITREQRERFADAYRLLVRKLDYFHGGKQLVLKNPASTARIPFLKDLFPRAKFIHIVRNPFKVFASSLGRYPVAMSSFSWQDFADLDFESQVIDFYKLLLRKYLEDREGLDPGDLYELKFESLTGDPVGELGKIYDYFGFGEREAAFERFGEYLEETGDYRKNVYRLTRAQVERIRGEWGFAFDEWNYSREPEGIEITGESVAGGAREDEES